MYQDLKDVHARAGARGYCTDSPNLCSAFPSLAWPGGYQLIYITDDGGMLCPECVNAESMLIAESFPGDGWHVVAVGTYNEAEAPEPCDHCGEIIVPSYGWINSDGSSCDPDTPECHY